MTQQHLRPFEAECVLICHRARKGIPGVFQRIPSVLQEQGEEDVFLAGIVVVKIQAGKADLPSDF